MRKIGHVNERGARSLADMAKTKTATQFKDLTVDHFASLPWVMAEPVWKELSERRGESFHAWRTLATAYPHAQEFGQRQYRYFMDIKQPQLPLSEYLSGMTSSELNWLTCFRVSPKQLSTTDLVSIHQITNLAVLDLSDGQITIDNNLSTFDERVMRAWAELASADQAFHHLRVMMFAWQENLSDWIFKYVNQFPSLCYIIVTDCPKIHQKNRVGWESISMQGGWEARHAKRSAKSLRPIISPGDFAMGSVSGCYYDSMSLFETLAEDRRPDLVEQLPILEAWIGTPRKWSHIVDDFPSTRTIFFENIKTKEWKKKTQPTGSEQQIKRVRDHEAAAYQGSASPPAKRAPQGRQIRKINEKSMAELLGEFKS